jgi:hypothetical protein
MFWRMLIQSSGGRNGVEVEDMLSVGGERWKETCKKSTLNYFAGGH